jgi:hypothetical protein
MTRLANTNGSIIIETIPAGPQGKIYELFHQFEHTKERTDAGNSIRCGFKVFEIPASEAVKAGVITQEFLDAEKQQLGGLYAQYYEAKFITIDGAIFLPSQVETVTKPYNLSMEEGSERLMAVDWGFGSSKTAIVGIELRADGRLYVVDCIQFERSSESDVIEFMAKLYDRDRYSRCYVDSSHPGIIKDLQEGSHVLKRPPIEVHPVVFRQELSRMVQDTIRAVKEGRILIHPEFTYLIQQLKTVQYDKRGNPDKSTYSMDIFDALMMAVSHARAGEILWGDLGRSNSSIQRWVSSNNYYSDNDPNCVGGIGFVSTCEICGRPVEGMMISWNSPSYCAEHQ